ncbi:MAG: shikimate kinase, partial [Deltaproteobacteria bacterium]|nr:shikimate kinase [Deltaproteobacteria bacterium]
MNLVLIGYRCSGKTEVGKKLARELGADFLDTDALVEQRAGCTIDHIITGKGWGAFREMERELIEELSEKDHLIIATGGGAVMDEANVSQLKRNGWLIWLKGSAEALKKRMTADHRSVSTRPS